MEIWLWIIGLVAAAVIVMVLVERRRGSTGSSRADDLPGTLSRNRDEGPGFSGGGGFGGGGDGGG